MSRPMIALTLLLVFFWSLPSHAAKSEIGSPRLMQGPMVGAVSPSEIAVWVRTSGPFECWLEFGEIEALSERRATEKIMASKDSDYCVTLRMTGLKPGTRYYYRVFVHQAEGSGFANLPAFHASTAPEGPAKFRVSLGSCLRWREDRTQPIWQVVEGLRPDLFFWVGDNIYGDTLDPDILAEEYARQRELPLMQRFLNMTPQLAIWDDHDYGLNDHDRTNPIKEQALEVFKRYWPNPGYGQPETPGVFFQYHYGGVDFYFLDGRYHRDPNDMPDSPEKTFLGKEQLAWLKAGLKASQSPFKVLVCGSGFNNGKGPGGDSWASALHERDALFDYIRDEAIGGVLLLSGDTHVGELNAIPWSERGGYDLYELVSSPMAQSPSGDNVARTPEMRIRPVFVEAPNAGVVDFDLTLEDPTVSLNNVDVYGLYTWEPVVIRASELRNGVASAKEKQNAAARQMETFSRGGSKALGKRESR